MVSRRRLRSAVPMVIALLAVAKLATPAVAADRDGLIDFIVI